MELSLEIYDKFNQLELPGNWLKHNNNRSKHSKEGMNNTEKTYKEGVNGKT